MVTTWRFSRRDRNSKFGFERDRKWGKGDVKRSKEAAAIKS